MTADTQPSDTARASNDIVAAVLEDREEINTMPNDVAASAPGDARRHRPESATDNLLLGPFVAVADRTRDPIRNAMDTSVR